LKIKEEVTTYRPVDGCWWNVIDAFTERLLKSVVLGLKTSNQVARSHTLIHLLYNIVAYIVSKQASSDSDYGYDSETRMVMHLSTLLTSGFHSPVTYCFIIIIIIIITNEKIKVMLLQKRCRGTLQDYNKGEISKCQSKLWTNRNVFSCCLNGTREETVRRDGGRLFHARGAATGKARSPRVDLCTGGTTSVVVADDRR